MDDVPIASHSFCVVEGCTSPSMISRMVNIAGEDRHLEFCWKHQDTEVTEADIDMSKVDEDGQEP